MVEVIHYTSDIHVKVHFSSYYTMAYITIQKVYLTGYFSKVLASQSISHMWY